MRGKLAPDDYHGPVAQCTFVINRTVCINIYEKALPLGMLCTFDAGKRFRKLLDFPINTEWADHTCDWADNRKRKIVSKKDKPPKCTASRKVTKQKSQDSSKPRKPLYLKAIESRSAGPTGRLTKKPVMNQNPLDLNREAVKCKVVSLHGLGSKLCVSGTMRVQSVPNVTDQWSDDGRLTDRSNLSLGSTINLDSGHKHSKYQVYRFRMYQWMSWLNFC